MEARKGAVEATILLMVVSIHGVFNIHPSRAYNSRFTDSHKGTLTYMGRLLVGGYGCGLRGVGRSPLALLLEQEEGYAGSRVHR